MQYESDILVLVQSPDGGLGQRLMQGVRRYLLRHRLTWSACYSDANWQAHVGDSLTRTGQAVLLLGFDLPPLLIEQAKRRAWPMAELSLRDNGVPLRVWPDDQAIGRVAAEHLLAQGYRRFAVPSPHPAPANRRRSTRAQSFIDRLADAGHRTDIVTIPATIQDRPAIDSFRTLLERGAGPLALFSYQDRQAVWILRTLAAIDIAVPQQVAVLGTDNSAIAAACEPPLSSVRIDWSLIAERALLALHRLLDQSPPQPTGTILVAPLSVRERTSSRPPLANEPLLLRAQTLIRRSLPRGIPVALLARRVGVTERHLSRQCQAVLGRSPAAWIRHYRLERVCDALLESDDSIGDIARQHGFVDSSHLARWFTRAYGCTPSAFRVP